MRRAKPRACASRRRSRARRCWPSPPTASSAPGTDRAGRRPTVDVPVSADWGPGAYALVTAWRPLDKPADRTPTRAIGLPGCGWSPSCARSPSSSARRKRSRRASVSRCRSRSAISGLRKRSSRWPRSTKASSADALQDARSRRLLLRQAPPRRLHARRLWPPAGNPRRRSRPHPRRRRCGDIGGLDIVPTRTVALFSGPVARQQRRGQDRARGPDFIGQLRLMAVAYSKSWVG